MRDRGKRTNVIIVLLDDCGFAQLGCFGAPFATPNIDALAADGVRHNAFHVTALCSPSRAALLTGRNHHAIGMGLFPETPTNRPGYSGRIPEGISTLPATLRSAGYATYAVGKWHLTPRGERSAAGPHQRWPLAWALTATTASSAPRRTCGHRTSRSTTTTWRRRTGRTEATT